MVLIGCQSQSSEPAAKANGEKQKVNPEDHLDVPFTSQAPEKNWDEPWQNACEEAAIVMVNAFYKNDDELTREEAKKKILKVLEVKRKELHVSLDENVETIVQLINALDVGFDARVVANPSAEDLIQEIQEGRPVILPVFAHELPNPYYEAEGPDYHVIVLVGYNKTKKVFRVNDPGTDRGEGLEFSYDVLMRAIHDLNTENYAAGSKKVVFTEPINFNDRSLDGSGKKGHNIKNNFYFHAKNHSFFMVQPQCRRSHELVCFDL